jgi:hypothetical protein
VPIMDYGFTPNGTTGIDAATSEERNKAIEAAELAHWQTQPDWMTGYFSFPRNTAVGRPPLYLNLTDATVSTWLGTIIGQIISARVYRHNFGSRIITLTMRGTNGAIYHGRASYDHGQCINLRRNK